MILRHEGLDGLTIFTSPNHKSLVNNSITQPIRILIGLLRQTLV